MINAACILIVWQDKVCVYNILKSIVYVRNKLTLIVYLLLKSKNNDRTHVLRMTFYCFFLQ